MKRHINGHHPERCRPFPRPSGRGPISAGRVAPARSRLSGFAAHLLCAGPRELGGLAPRARREWGACPGGNRRSQRDVGAQARPRARQSLRAQGPRSRAPPGRGQARQGLEAASTRPPPPAPRRPLRPPTAYDRLPPYTPRLAAGRRTTCLGATPPAACRASLPRPHPHPSRALRAGGAPACSRPCRGRQTATRRGLAGAARAQGTPVASQPLASVLGRSQRLLADSATRSRWGVGGSWARRGGRSHSGRRGTYTGRRLVDGPV